MKTKGRAYRHWFFAGLFFGLSMSASAGPSSPVQAPLYVSFTDQVPPPEGRALPGLDKEQRNAVFRAALQTAADTGVLLPPMVVMNGNGTVPAGTTWLRLHLRQWSNTRAVGFEGSDIFCRIDAEIVRGNRPSVRLGPYTGITSFDPTAMTAPENRRVIFREAARRAIDEMARALPR